MPVVEDAVRDVSIFSRGGDDYACHIPIERCNGDGAVFDDMELADRARKRERRTARVSLRPGWSTLLKPTQRERLRARPATGTGQALQAEHRQ